MFQILDTQVIEELLSVQLVGHLGCHADGVTYVVPISYAYDGSYVYARTFDGMKLEMLRKNPSVCFQVEDTLNLTNWKSVVCWGEFEEIRSETGRRQAIRMLLERTLPILSSETMHITPDWPFSDFDADNVEGVLFRIRLRKKTGRAETISIETN